MFSYTFTYKVVNKNNQILEGNIEAFSRRRAASILKEDGSTVLWVFRKKDSLLGKDI
jgi:type II secretory pathway component PulF